MALFRKQLKKKRGKVTKYTKITFLIYDPFVLHSLLLFLSIALSSAIFEYD